MTAALADAEAAGVQRPARAAFVVSDGTGLTAETLSRALLASFPGFDFDRRTIPFVDTEAAARAVVADINSTSVPGLRPILFLTVRQGAIRAILGRADAVIVDLLNGHLSQLEAELATEATERPAPQLSTTGLRRSRDRMRAVEYAIEHDDGQSVRALDEADLILLAPSRCGKTETALYLAVEHGLLVANVPLVDDSVQHGDGLATAVVPHLRRCFGLTSTPLRLSQVRSERWPHSRYSSLQQCTLELRRAEELYRRRGIPFLNSAMKSVEETAAAIIRTMDLRTEPF